MSFNDQSGFFITEEESTKYGVEYVEELENEVHNLRNVIEEAKHAAYELFKLLDNA